MTENVEIVLRNGRAYFSGKYPRDLVDDCISAKVEGAQFSPQFKRKQWDGYSRFLSRTSNSFPMGLTSHVRTVLEEEGYTVVIHNDELTAMEYALEPGISSNLRDGFEMVPSAGEVVFRDYQMDAGRAFLSGKSDTPYRSILHMGTGSGKTFVAAGITYSLNQYGEVPTLFLVHGRELVQQTYKAFLKVFEPEVVGICMGDVWNPSLITIASVDTIYSKLKSEDTDVLDLLDSIVFVIADECHRASSKSWAIILDKANAPFRLGLSGTPMKRQDERDLRLLATTGPVVYHLETSTLQEGGYVSLADLTTVIITQPEMRSLPWQDAFRSLIVANTNRTKIIADLAIKRAREGKTVLILAGNSVQFAKNIHEQISRKHKSCSVVTGVTKTIETNKAFDELRDKKLDILVTTLLADEGVDVPAVNVLMLVGGGKSYVKAIQRVGRGLRMKEDGTSLEVIEFLDLTNKFLEKHAQARLDYYTEAKIFQNGVVIEDSSYTFGV